MSPERKSSGSVKIWENSMKIRPDCEQSARILGTTPSGCAGAPPQGKDTYRKGALCGKEISRDALCKSFDLFAQIGHTTSHQSRRLVGRAGCNRSRVGERINLSAQ